MSDTVLYYYFIFDIYKEELSLGACLRIRIVSFVHFTDEELEQTEMNSFA